MELLIGLFFVGFAIWFIRGLVKRPQKQDKADKAPAVPMIKRIIKAPDGRMVTMIVPADEPTSVSIAKLYPQGEGPPPPPPGMDHVDPRYAPPPATAPKELVAEYERRLSDW